MRHPIVLIALVVTALAQGPARPSFAGHWSQVEQPVAIAGRVPFCPSACTVEQTSDTITFADSMTETGFKLNGEPTTTMAYAPTLTATIHRTAKWDGAALVLTQETQSDSLNSGAPYTTTARVSISLDGRLTLEGVRGNKDGTQNKYRVVYARSDK